jgi:hypothetical protein
VILSVQCTDNDRVNCSWLHIIYILKEDVGLDFCESLNIENSFKCANNDPILETFFFFISETRHIISKDNWLILENSLFS